MEDKKKVMLIFGTRPEAIKLAPVVLEIHKRSDRLQPVVCVTAQHRGMLDQVLECFNITPDYDLNVMRPGQDLFHITSRNLEELKKVLLKESPDWVLVQGDTTTTFTGALAAFYNQIPVGHVEAGLRTYQTYSPFPEEVNRKLTTQLSRLHFAPTEKAKANLLREAVPAENIKVTGNTAIDALLSVAGRQYDFKNNGLGFLDPSRPIIVVTAHRRESFGEPFLRVCRALSIISDRLSDCQLVYPVHLNPNVRGPVFEQLGNKKNVHLIEPLDYEPFVHLMAASRIILTDSGGIQEEAPSLNKPVLILRETTERPEVVEVGAAQLVGTDIDTIVGKTIELIESEAIYDYMSSRENPFGDGFASKRIVDSIVEGDDDLHVERRHS